MPSRNIGGSLLPSSEPRIRKPVETPFGTLQVKVIDQLDTHGLFHKDDRGERLLAEHPNGYSCHELLLRMQKRDVRATTEQVNYILDCGGTARRIEHILSIIT